MSEPASSTGTILVLVVGFLVLNYCRQNQFMVSQSLVFINFSIFATWWILVFIQPSMAIDALLNLGFKPLYLQSLNFELLTLFSSMFMHGSPMHLLMNMLILILLGVPFEDRIGSKSFLRIYVISGLLGSLLTGIISVWNEANDLETIHIGASGAVFGIMGAFVLLYPRLEIPMLLGPIFMQRVPVLLSTIVFVGMETLYVGLGTDDGIGHGTHMASFVGGVFLAPYYASKAKESKEVIDFDLSLLSKINEKTGMGGHELKMIKDSDEPELVEAWVDEFWKIQKCPNCEGNISPKGKCSSCNSNFIN